MIRIRLHMCIIVYVNACAYAYVCEIHAWRVQVLVHQLLLPTRSLLIISRQSEKGGWQQQQQQQQNQQDFLALFSFISFLGIAGFVAAGLIGAYKYRHRGTMSTSVFLMQLRVAAQGTVVGCLTVGLGYQMAKEYIFDKQPKEK